MSGIEKPSNASGQYRKKDVTKELQIACGQAFGFGAGYSMLVMVRYILEHGIPSRAERDALVAERLSEDGTAEPA